MTTTTSLLVPLTRMNRVFRMWERITGGRGSGGRGGCGGGGGGGGSHKVIQVQQLIRENDDDVAQKNDDEGKRRYCLFHNKQPRVINSNKRKTCKAM